MRTVLQPQPLAPRRVAATARKRQWHGAGWLLLLALGAAPAAWSQCTQTSETGGVQPAAMRASVTGIEVGDVSRDRLQLRVAVAMLADRDASVNQITFSDLRVNGLPFYADPNTMAVHLVAGQQAALPQPLPLDLYYRDLDTLQPLIELLREGRARIEGTVLLNVNLNLAQSLFLQKTHAQVAVPFRDDVAVQFPGGLGMRAAALAAAGAANLMLERVQAGAESALAQTSRRRRELVTQFAPAMLLARSRFSLEDGHGNLAAFTCRGTGFGVGGGQFVLLKQMVQPWNFDPEIAAAMHERHLTMVPGSYALHVWPAEAAVEDTAAGWSDARHEIQVVRLAKDDDADVMVPREKGRPTRFQLGRQASAGNLALLAITAAGAELAAMPLATAGVPADGASGHFATFRMARDAHPELLFLDGAGGDAGVRLAAPVDASAWGAPLIGEAGVVGIIQDEHTALPLAAVRQALGIPQ